MSDAALNLPREEAALVSAAREKASVFDIFLAFLTIGATSFGGVVPYLREDLVSNRHWVDDKEVVELLSISQSLSACSRRPPLQTPSSPTIPSLLHAVLVYFFSPLTHWRDRRTLRFGL